MKPIIRDLSLYSVVIALTASIVLALAIQTWKERESARRDNNNSVRVLRVYTNDHDRVDVIGYKRNGTNVVIWERYERMKCAYE